MTETNNSVQNLGGDSALKITEEREYTIIYQNGKPTEKGPPSKKEKKERPAAPQTTNGEFETARGQKLRGKNDHMPSSRRKGDQGQHQAVKLENTEVKGSKAVKAV